MSAKASKVLNFLRHTLWDATTEAKFVTYKCLLRPLLEYACTVWNSHTVSDRAFHESVHNMQYVGFVLVAGPLCGSFGVSHRMPFA